jgi:hypothetical protein
MDDAATAAEVARQAGRSSVVGPSRPRLLKVLGPGLISGPANDDPCAIATYSQAGAAFGYGLCWLMPVAYPLMAVVQQVSGRIGRTTGTGSRAPSPGTTRDGCCTPWWGCSWSRT